ncbi:MAG: hypothetical protein IOD12_12975 [Silvanigrellales bacterium]|nr:hypothetical protein [Silvanigrellales bacterium]
MNAPADVPRPDIQDCLQSLLEYACQPEFSQQMHIARELYSLATGKVNDDDPFYEARMASFQEFFTFDYRLAEVFSGATVFELFLLNAQTTLSPEAIGRFEQLRSQQHSLYFVERLRDDAILVHDLISNARFVACPLRDWKFDGFETGVVFEGRLVSFEGRHYFTGAFIFHPKDVTGLIFKLVKNFLLEATFCKATGDLDWRAELQRRHELLAEVASRKREAEKSEKKRAIDMLNVTKHLVHVSRTVSNPQLVMALGRDAEVSPFVPETMFLDVEIFLQKLAYCNLRSFRYKHIDPLKVYDLEVAANHGLAVGLGASLPETQTPLQGASNAAGTALKGGVPEAS